MRALIIVAAAALAVSACTHMTTAQKVDTACETAVLIAQATGDVAEIAAHHGADPVTAERLAARAATGENVVGVICTIGQSIPLQR